MSRVVFFTSNTSWFLYNFRRKTIRAYVDKGYKVICLAPQDAFSYRLSDELGAEFHAIPLEGKSVAVLRELVSLIFILKSIKNFKPAIVFNSTVKMNIYGGVASYVLNTPFVNNISGLGTAFIHNSWLFRRVRQVYGFVNQRAQYLFFENEEDLAVFYNKKMLGATPHSLLPGSGVDLQQFQASELPPGGPVTFIMIARLLGDKGVREYAEACGQLQAQGLDVRCLLVGPLGVSNRTAITEEEVSAWVARGWLEYLGETDDVRPLIEQAHVLVLPSYREGMPRTVLEAAAMGRPAIVTDVPGCWHAIEPEVTGWLCEVRNADSLARQMRHVYELTQAERQQAGNAARKRMEDRFSEELVVQAYLGCLTDEQGRAP